MFYINKYHINFTDLEISKNIEDLNHGSYEEIAKEYDEIIGTI